MRFQPLLDFSAWRDTHRKFWFNGAIREQFDKQISWTVVFLNRATMCCFFENPLVRLKRCDTPPPPLISAWGWSCLQEMCSASLCRGGVIFHLLLAAFSAGKVTCRSWRREGVDKRGGSGEWWGEGGRWMNKNLIQTEEVNCVFLW